MDYEIRRATVTDAAAIASLAAELNAHFGVTEPAFPGDALIPVMQGDDPLVGGFLAFCGDTPVGYTLYQKFFDTDTGTPAIWLLDLYLSPDHRGRGIGRRLIAQVAARATDMGQRCVSLAVYHDNPARRLYDRIGAALPKDALVYELRDQHLISLAQEAQR